MDPPTEDEYFFETVENVKSVIVDAHNSERHYILYTDPIQKGKDESKCKYYVMETLYHDAFAHWVYETAAYLHMFKFDGKIILKSTPERNYKRLFLTLHGISEEFLHWTDTNIIPEGNVCRVLKSFCLNDKNPSHLPRFRILLDEFHNRLYLPQQKTIERLFFPRNKLQNYTPNDRIIDYSSFYRHVDGFGYVEYDTQQTTDFKDQIRILTRSKNVYLDYGSSFLVNGVFCKGSTIYISGRSEQHTLYPLLNEIFKYIEGNNKIIFL